MKKFLFLLLISNYCFASDFLILFDIPENKKYIKFKPIQNLNLESKKAIPPLSSLVPIPKGDSIQKFVLDGVVKADNKLIAIINGNLYKIGDKLDEYKITDITLNYVELENKGKKEKIFIK